MTTRPRAILTNQGCLELIAPALEHFEIDSTIVEDKEAALVMHIDEPFDIAIGLPCPQLCAMKRVNRDTILIATSSWLLDPWARPHLKQVVRHFDSHLILPFSYSELVATIERGAAVTGRQDVRSHIMRAVGRKVVRRDPWPTCQRFNGNGKLVRIY